MSILLVSLALVLAVDAHKKFYSAPQYEGNSGPGQCICDCATNHGPPILPNKPYYGSGGYAPRPAAGYGNAGSYAVSGSYGSGGQAVSGGY